MKKIFLLFLCIQCLSFPILYAQESSSETENVLVETVNNSDDLENQQINKDEGYGAEDEEYYGSEENSVDKNTT